MERPLPLGHVARPCDKKWESVFEPLQQRMWSKDPYTCRCELDRERQAVEALADLYRLAIVNVEIRDDGGRRDA